MIVFELIKWMNFLSTGNAWNEVILCKDSTTLIVGKNGHGKSTLLDALTFALFGKPFRNINKPNLVNSINGKNLKVELTFHVGPKSYKIVRGIAPAVFEVYIDGELQNQDAISGDYQSYLENNILKFNHKAFTQIVILGSKSFVPFMKLRSADRRSIIENLLDIEIFSSMNKIAKEQFKKCVESVATNKTNIDNTKQKIILQQKYAEDAKKQSKEQIESVQADITNNKADLTRLETHETTLLDRITKLNELIGWRETFRTKLDKTELKMEDNGRAMNKFNEEYEFYNTHDHCPTCKQDIATHVRDKCKMEALEGHRKSKETYEEAQIKAVTWNDMLKQVETYQKDHNAVMVEINTIRVSKTHINKYITKLEADITEIQNKKVLSDDMMEISEKLVDELEGYVAARTQLVEDRAYYEGAVSLLKDDAIKAQIIKQYLPVINMHVNKYLASMDFFVNFELDEEFEETIKSRHRDDFTYDSFSEGEKQKIDIALLFAWRAIAKLKNSMSTNLLIMDEIFDSSLDGVGADLVLSILGALPEGSNIFVISHRELLHDRFGTTIRFEKRNNFSEIVRNGDLND